MFITTHPEDPVNDVWPASSTAVPRDDLGGSALRRPDDLTPIPWTRDSDLDAAPAGGLVTFDPVPPCWTRPEVVECVGLAEVARGLTEAEGRVLRCSVEPVMFDPPRELVPTAVAALPPRLGGQGSPTEDTTMPITLSFSSRHCRASNDDNNLTANFANI